MQNQDIIWFYMLDKISASLNAEVYEKRSGIKTMEATDIIRFFLHDKIAAKKWKRYAEREHDGIITYQYVSTNSDEYGFDIVLHESYGNMWFSIWSPTSAITLFKEDICGLRSLDHSLWIYFGEYSYILLAYGRKGDEL